ncbi:Aste57867_11495 [Aphanomyces stellatus]|uniref:Aste57867_11495 protein n=1 Tax=Aphanomyces stellatus TaxID=120398 RepID=A0A485KTN8_9STRA|nr:hypothetical protein As57867_011452 [Aphanomyces stellatus]VFT88356.1 Aste57867_11495 [Aphanomyces stellatus]
MLVESWYDFHMDQSNSTNPPRCGRHITTTAMASVQEQVLELERLQATWHEMEQRIRANLAKAAQLITLNVGGTLFTTSKETLVRIPGSYFHAMLGSGLWQPDGPHGSYFLDMDPLHFDRVMMYLRQGELSMDGLSDWDVRQLERTMAYLNLPIPSDATWTWNPKQCHESITLSETNRCAFAADKTTNGTYQSVLGSSPVTQFRVRINEMASDDLYIGLTPQKGVHVSAYNPTKGGVYMQADGHVYANGGKTVCFSRLRRGDMILMRRADGNISIELNGQELGVAGTVDPTVDLFPVLCTWARAKVSIVY